jgi:hypothetical protein
MLGRSQEESVQITLVERVILEFDLSSASSRVAWAIAADRLEDRGQYSASIRSKTWTPSPYYSNDDGDDHGHGHGNGHGEGDGDGDGYGYGEGYGHGHGERRNHYSGTRAEVPLERADSVGKGENECARYLKPS